jgi:hypothetical protein
MAEVDAAAALAGADGADRGTAGVHGRGRTAEPLRPRPRPRKGRAVRRPRHRQRGAAAPAWPGLVLAALLAGGSGSVCEAAPAAVGAMDSVRARPEVRPTRVYVGMWSTHLRDIDRGLSANSLIGVSWRGYFGGTFINSFGDRALSAGLQRSISGPGPGALAVGLGYRAGVITGYDERFFGIGHMFPVIPFAQLLGHIDLSRFGIELSYAGVVASVAMNLRL